MRPLDQLEARPLAGTEGALHPVWAPDGRRLVYSAKRKFYDLLIKDDAGAREAEVLIESAEDKFTSDWSRDGKYLLFISQGKDTSWHVWALPMTGEKKPFPVAKTRFGEGVGTFSPDGQRFLVLAPLGQDAVPPTTVVLNWSTGIRQGASR